MSKVGISVKIDVTRIEKARLFEGQKGKYLDATMFVDLDDLWIVTGKHFHRS